MIKNIVDYLSLALIAGWTFSHRTLYSSRHRLSYTHHSSSISNLLTELVLVLLSCICCGTLLY